MCACAHVWVLGYRGTGNPDAFVSVTETGLKELGICHHFAFRMWHRAFLGFLFSCILANIVQNGLSSFQGVRQRQRSLPSFFVFVLNHPSVTKKNHVINICFWIKWLKMISILWCKWQMPGFSLHRAPFIWEQEFRDFCQGQIIKIIYYYQHQIVIIVIISSKCLH